MGGDDVGVGVGVGGDGDDRDGDGVDSGGRMDGGGRDDKEEVGGFVCDIAISNSSIATSR